MTDTFSGARLARRIAGSVFALAMAVGIAGLRPSPCLAQGDDQVPLPIKLPRAVFAGTPNTGPVGHDVEKPLGHARPIPLVAKGTTNIALHKKVTSSKAPFSGTLDLVTDGDKEARDDSVLELKPKLQWIQIDLAATSQISYICVWHFHSVPVIFHDVIVQASNDPLFITGVTTLFNNDHENNAGRGIGKDREYFETNEGKLIDAKGVKARYVRLYSNGSTHSDPLNRYTEVEVYGIPVK